MIPKNLHKIIFAALICLATPFTSAQKSGAQPKGVRHKFSSAMQDYGDGQFKKAARKFSRILKRYKQHTPSIIQLGLSYYNLEKYDKAYAVFSKLDQQDISKNFYFEYAYTSYNKKQWSKSSLYFSKVTKTHPLYDLAMYYAGVSFFNLEKYSDAKKYLMKSAVLPSSFSSSRRTLLKLSGDKIKRVKETPQAKAEIKLASRGEPLSKEILQDALEAVLLRKASNKFDLGYNSRRTLSSIDSEDKQESTKSKAYVSFQTGLDAEVFGRESSSGIDLTLWGTSFNKSNYRGILTYEDQQDFLDYHFSSDYLKNTIGANLTPWTEFKVFGQNLGLEYLISSFKGSSEEIKDPFSHRATLYLESAPDIFSYLAEFKQYKLLIDGSELVVDTRSMFSIEYDFPSDSTLSVGIEQTNLEFSQNSEGPSSKQKLLITARQLLPLNGEIKTNISATRLNSYLIPFSEANTFIADGTMLDFSATLLLKLSNWLSLDLSQSFRNYSWTNVKPEVAAETWKANVPTFEDTFSLQLNIKKVF